MQKCQNVPFIRVSHARSVFSLSLRVRSQKINVVNVKLSKLTNHRVYLERGIENNAYRLHFPFSLRLPVVFMQLFSVRFPYYLGAWNRLPLLSQNMSQFGFSLSKPCYRKATETSLERVRRLDNQREQRRWGKHSLIGWGSLPLIGVLLHTRCRYKAQIWLGQYISIRNHIY